MTNLTHGALFQGIGGFSLAARNQGISTLWECEIDDYCHKLSKKNFPEIKTRYRDIREMINEKNKIRKVSVISGGFPCQPFSTAGKRKGKEDNRYLWPQTIEVIKRVRPDWVILENVPGIINLALDNVLDDVEAAGYTQETFIIPALSVGANHRRDRVWIVANSRSGRFCKQGILSKQQGGAKVISASQIVSNSERWGREAGSQQTRWETGKKLTDVFGKHSHLWPTPDAQMAKHAAPTEWEMKHGKEKTHLHCRVGGQLNPMWVEWLMGYPEGWTDLKD